MPELAVEIVHASSLTQDTSRSLTPTSSSSGESRGSHRVVLDIISTAAAHLPRHVPVRAATLTTEPLLAGLRLEALSRLRSTIVTTAHRAHAARTAPPIQAIN
jgi:hypothetical protein